MECFILFKKSWKKLSIDNNFKSIDWNYHHQKPKTWYVNGKLLKLPDLNFTTKFHKQHTSLYLHDLTFDNIPHIYIDDHIVELQKHLDFQNIKHTTDQKFSPSHCFCYKTQVCQKTLPFFNPSVHFFLSSPFVFFAFILFIRVKTMSLITLHRFKNNFTTFCDVIIIKINTIVFGM